MRLVLGHVTALLVAGTCIGVVLSLWAATFVHALLFRVDARDPIALGGRRSFSWLSACLPDGFLRGKQRVWIPAPRSAAEPHATRDLRHSRDPRPDEALVVFARVDVGERTFVVDAALRSFPSRARERRASRRCRDRRARSSCEQRAAENHGMTMTAVRHRPHDGGVAFVLRGHQCADRRGTDQRHVDERDESRCGARRVDRHAIPPAATSAVPARSRDCRQCEHPRRPRHGADSSRHPPRRPRRCHRRPQSRA